MSWWVWLSPQRDTALGVLDYEPFTFDVGALDVMFVQVRVSTVLSIFDH